MTATDLRAHIARLGLTQSGLAHALGVETRTVQRWAAGQSDVPEPVARLLRVADRGLIERLRLESAP